MAKSTREAIWEKKGERELAERILKLRDTQIGALLSLTAGFKSKDIEHAVAEIREHGLRSGHLPILVGESDPEELTWWVNYFESPK